MSRGGALDMKSRESCITAWAGGFSLTRVFTSTYLPVGYSLALGLMPVCTPVLTKLSKIK